MTKDAKKSPEMTPEEIQAMLAENAQLKAAVAAGEGAPVALPSSIQQSTKGNTHYFRVTQLKNGVPVATQTLPSIDEAEAIRLHCLATFDQTDYSETPRHKPINPSLFSWAVEPVDPKSRYAEVIAKFDERGIPKHVRPNFAQ